MSDVPIIEADFVNDAFTNNAARLSELVRGVSGG